MTHGKEGPVVGWIAQYVGFGRRYRSLLALARAAHIDPKTLYNFINTGKADANTLIKLARATDENPVRLMRLVGLLTDEDVGERGEGKAPAREYALAGL